MRGAHLVIRVHDKLVTQFVGETGEFNTDTVAGLAGDQRQRASGADAYGGTARGE